MSNRASLTALEQKHWNALLNGKQSGLFELYQLFYKYLYDYGIRICNDQELIKDCIQSLFLHIWEKRETLGIANNVRYYLVSSFKRNLFEVIKKEKKTDSIDTYAVQNYSAESVEEEIIRNQDIEHLTSRLSKAIQSLPPKQQQLIYLKYYKGHSYEEIAKITETSIRTVYNQTNLAIQALRNNKQLRINEQQIIALLYLFGEVYTK